MQNNNVTESFPNVLQKRYSRRQFLYYSGMGAVALGVSTALKSQPFSQSQVTTSVVTHPNANFNFTEIPHGFSKDTLVSPDYASNVLIRWGDPLFPNAPKFNVHQQSPASQEQQFGFNNDYIGYLSLPTHGQQQARALLCVNHEYALDYMMFPELAAQHHQKQTLNKTLNHIQIEQASVGNSIVEIEKVQDQWQVVISSEYNRRITALSSQMAITGPAAGHARMQTSKDATGQQAIGTLMNCAGGMTPWGTYLTCEENFNNVFTGSLNKEHKEFRNHQRYQVNNRQHGWGELDPRFNIEKEPNEANRFGWVVEIDPKNPNSTPKKRTALGRFKHEGAECVIADSGELVVYMGDDAYFEYLYKFVSRDKVDLENPANNTDLLDKGTLYAAEFLANGQINWLPLIYGQGQLTQKHGFTSQADIVIEARYAADLIGATPMDRPEDVVPNKLTGQVYVILTNNKNRTAEQTNKANPRANNLFGQIIEINEGKQNGDFASINSHWDMLLQAGNPQDKTINAKWHPDISQHGWFACPDAGVIDPQGRFWISTDQGSDISNITGTNDGLWAVETQGELKGHAKMFFRGPNGAEVTGPQFSDDGKALFIAIQHPGVDESNGEHNSLLSATSYWPDFKKNMPPRPSIVVIQHHQGKIIG